MGNDDGNSDDRKEDPFRTRRMQTLSGLNPAFAPGEFVYLQATMPGFDAGTRFKVVSARATGPGQYLYELTAGDQTIWVAQKDLRGTAPEKPANPLANTSSNPAFSMTQRMQTMTLSQRMDALGIGDAEDLGATQRMRAFNFEDDLRRQAAGKPAPDVDGPVTGMPSFQDEPAAKDKPPK
jgi:hypothetical protein